MRSRTFLAKYGNFEFETPRYGFEVGQNVEVHGITDSFLTYLNGRKGVIVKFRLHGLVLVKGINPNNSCTIEPIHRNHLRVIEGELVS